MANKSFDAIIDEIKKSPRKKVKVAITDIDGILRGKYIHVDKFLSAVKSGFGFCNVVFGWDAADVCYDNVKYTGWHSGYPDANANLDLNTYRKMPWNDNVPFLLGDFTDDKGTALSACPRSLLKRILGRAEQAGYNVMAGLEFEFFNFKETAETLDEKQYSGMQPLTPGMFGYSVLRAGQSQDYFNAIFDQLLSFDVPLEGIHTETGPGVYEAAIQVSDALEAADRSILFKAGVKRIAHDFGIMPTFMAKWHKDLPGSSGHIHQSLWSKDGKQNVFYDEKDEFKMSDTFKSFIAGQILLMPEFLCFYAPTINSYKRLVEGLWAPTRVTWGVDNRTASLRVIPGSEKSTRLETRVSGADINPYLALAASIASGLYGIENKLELKDARIVGNAYEARKATRLPANLYEAAKKLQKSKVAAEMFGAEFVEHFAESRFWEWRQYEQSVTNWEIQRYFEII